MESMTKYLSNIVEDKFVQCGYDKKYGFVTVSDRPDLCDFQCNGALQAAKEYKKSPVQIANEVIKLMEGTDIFDSISVAGPGFINIKIKGGFLIGYLNKMYTSRKFGLEEADKKETIIIDYGGANVAKPLHVGHLRSAIIGETLKRTAHYLGHNVIGDVHLGDWGLQIGMVITELKRRKPDLPYFNENFEGDYPEEAPFTIDELEEIYPAASKLAKSDEKAMEEAKEATLELQNGKKSYIALWKHILNVSVADLKKNYGALDVEFDLWKGESDSQKYIGKMVDYLKENHYTYESEGALVIDVSSESDTFDIPPFMLLKSDGASLYSTTDLATIWERVKKYDPDRIIYVVDKRQSLHFEQVFRCAKKTKIAPEKLKFDYIGFGTMNGKDGKPFKTREGGVMRLSDLIAMIKSNVRGKLEGNKTIDAEEMDEIARKVGLAALKYGDLSNQATKDYVFDLDKFASFEGNTGPYILYTVVRIKSILHKIGENAEEIDTKFHEPYNAIERDLMLKIVKFNETVEEAFVNRMPNRICEFLFDVSNQFNKFYHEYKIVTEEDAEKKLSWIRLIVLTKNVLTTGLTLLGMEVPDRM